MLGWNLSSEESGGNGGASDHGALTGLSDDDHAHYELVNARLAAKGSIPVHNGTNVNPKLVGLDGQSLFADNGQADGLAYLDHQRVCCGRLTLESGVPVPPTDQAAKTTLYLSPYKGNQISLYNGSNSWQLFEFAERSLSLAGLTSGRSHDIFAYNDSGAVKLESSTWSSANIRNANIVRQDGIYTKDGAATRRYLGTIYTSATGQTEDSKHRRHVWNYNNRRARPIRLAETAGSWTCSSSTWRVMRGTSFNTIQMVIGIQDDAVSVTQSVLVKSTDDPRICISWNSITVSSGLIAYMPQTSVASYPTISVCRTGWPPKLGYNYLAPLEMSGSGTSTFWGVATNGNYQEMVGVAWT